MMTTNLFVIANVKQLRTGGSFRIALPFFQTSWGVGVPDSVIFNIFHSWVEFGTILEGLWNFGFKPPLLSTPLKKHSISYFCNIIIVVFFLKKKKTYNYT